MYLRGLNEDDLFTSSASGSSDLTVSMPSSSSFSIQTEIPQFFPSNVEVPEIIRRTQEITGGSSQGSYVPSAPGMQTITGPQFALPSTIKGPAQNYGLPPRPVFSQSYYDSIKNSVYREMYAAEVDKAQYNWDKTKIEAQKIYEQALQDANNTAKAQAEKAQADLNAQKLAAEKAKGGLLNQLQGAIKRAGPELAKTLAALIQSLLAKNPQSISYNQQLEQMRQYQVLLDQQEKGLIAEQKANEELQKLEQEYAELQKKQSSKFIYYGLGAFALYYMAKKRHA